MNCIIIDDEPESANIIQRYMEQIEDLRLLHIFRHPVKALPYLQENEVDLIFLDINMPGINGLEFLKILLPVKAVVIFTTAYREFAAESYEYNAADYLVKPIRFERFLQAVMKARQNFAGKKPSPGTLKSDDKEIIVLKSGNLIHRVAADDILFVEKKDNYLNFQTIDKKILVRGAMSDVFNYLPQELFCRVHKSFVISIKHTKAVEVHQLYIKDYKIPFGETYREEALQRLVNNPLLNSF